MNGINNSITRATMFHNSLGTRGRILMTKFNHVGNCFFLIYTHITTTATSEAIINSHLEAQFKAFIITLPLKLQIAE